MSNLKIETINDFITNMDFPTIMPYIVGFVLFIIVFRIIKKTMKNLFSQSDYLKALRIFAEEKKIKKPISSKTFLFIEILGFLGILGAIYLFFINPFYFFGATIIFVLLVIIIGVKTYVLPLKRLAKKEGLFYVQDNVRGSYHNRELIVEKKEVKAGYPNNDIINRDRRLNFKKDQINLALSFDSNNLNSISFNNKIIQTEPVLKDNQLDQAQKMINKIPEIDAVQLGIKTINDRKYVMLEKTNNNFLFIAELYYLIFLVEKITKAVDALGR